MDVGDELFSWGGPDLPSFPAARLDAAMELAEQRHRSQHPRRNLTGAQALVRVTEFTAVLPDWDEDA